MMEPRTMHTPSKAAPRRNLLCVAVGISVLAAVGIALTTVFTGKDEPSPTPALANPRGWPLLLDSIVQDEDTTNILYCRVKTYDLLYEQQPRQSMSQVFYQCHPFSDVDDEVDQGYMLDVPREESSRLFLEHDHMAVHYWRIPGGSFVDGNTVVPDWSLVTPLWHNAEVQDKRHMLASSGTYSALGIRVVDSRGKAPTRTEDELYKLWFTDNVSLKWQYHRCSNGKVTIEPSGLGVITVTVDLNKDSSTANAMANKAQEKAVAYINSRLGTSYTSVREYSDLVLIVTPEMSWGLAYATFTGGLSVYNNLWGSYIASLMHEVGHNFGLTHANDKGSDFPAANADGIYMDFTSYMSAAMIGYHDQENFPQMCFNAANHALMGWHEGRVKEVDPARPEFVRLAPFVDYDMTLEGYDYTVLRIGSSFYAQWNRAKKHNSEVYIKGDDVVLVQDEGGGTELVSTIAPTASEAIKTNLWNIEICEVVPAASGRTEHLVVSVGKGASCANYDDGDSIVTPQAEESCGESGAGCASHDECCSGRCRITPIPSWNSCSAPVDASYDSFKLSVPFGRGSRTSLGSIGTRRLVRGQRTEAAAETELPVTDS